MIPLSPFGATNHASSRVIFGAAGVGWVNQARADQALELLLEYGINHIDVAASYGEAELRVGAWMAEYRKHFFLATKTGERTASAAWDGLQRSLERLQVDQIDLIQLHNLVDENEWQQAMGPGGAIEALAEAKSQGLVRFLGVTGHGTRVAAMHIRSLDRFPFDSVLLPCNFTLMSLPEYASDFERLYELCQERRIAMQTIKAVARRRWQQNSGPRFSWYEPLRDQDAIGRAVAYVLARENLFLNSSSDLTILHSLLEAATGEIEAPESQALQADVERFGAEPLFVPGVLEEVGP